MLSHDNSKEKSKETTIAKNSASDTPPQSNDRIEEVPNQIQEINPSWHGLPFVIVLLKFVTVIIKYKWLVK